MTTPRLLSERYELGETLGYGGMSEVHRGLDTRLGRDVAVKVLRADLARDPQFQMRFRREAQNAAALNHPAIVAVYDTGEVQSEFGPLPYIVMEYVDGQTLREIVKTTGPMSQQKVIEVMADVCAALDFSHRHQIIHRDVKPANIMITRAGAVKVMDFGIARALGEGQNVTQTAAVIGTAQYLSPEQARGEAVDARSDVYAAGCVLFELLTGEPPFTGDTPVAVAYQHVREDPRRPSEVNPDIPAALDAVVLKALSKNPANRYQSSAEMRNDLVRVRAGQAPLAPTVMSEDERIALLAAGAGGAAAGGMAAGGITRRLNGGRHAGAAVPADQWDDDEPPRRGGRRLAFGIAAAIVLGLIAFAAYQIFSGPPPPAQVVIPDVVGQQTEVARSELLGLNLLVDTQPAESDVDEIGLVVRTDPAAQVQVPERSRVTMFIGSGPAEASVPPLQGRTVEEAEQLLAQRGLSLGQQSEVTTTDTELVGRIVRSVPGPGETVAGGSAVAVEVGVAPATVAVPDVRGQSAGDAQRELEAAGFEVNREDVDGGGEEGSVLATTPPAGTQAERGAAVTMQVSRGNQIEVPDVVGLSPRDANDELQNAGFRVAVTVRPVDDREQDGRVVEQSIPGGQSAREGEQIVITIGQFSRGSRGRDDDDN
jgi:beta-lactam-binding protein with PASTA domain/predicted Ser/Thr protein kinase